MPAGLVSGEELQTIRSAIRSQFSRLYGNRLVQLTLYGSQARGDAKLWSDIDVLVVLRGPVRPSLEVRRTGVIVSSLSLEHDTVIQCLFVDEERFRRGMDPLRGVVAAEGIEL